jgi:hypothetical protein
MDKTARLLGGRAQRSPARPGPRGLVILMTADDGTGQQEQGETGRGPSGEDTDGEVVLEKKARGGGGADGEPSLWRWVR